MNWLKRFERWMDPRTEVDAAIARAEALVDYVSAALARGDKVLVFEHELSPAELRIINRLAAARPVETSPEWEWP